MIIIALMIVSIISLSSDENHKLKYNYLNIVRTNEELILTIDSTVYKDDLAREMISKLDKVYIDTEFISYRKYYDAYGHFLRDELICKGGVGCLAAIHTYY